MLASSLNSDQKTDVILLHWNHWNLSTLAWMCLACSSLGKLASCVLTTVELVMDESPHVRVTCHLAILIGRQGLTRIHLNQHSLSVFLVGLSASPTRSSLLHGQDQPGLQWWQCRALIAAGIAFVAIKFHLSNVGFKVKIHFCC